jgi:hydroxymethylglutaryl-CoA lyase
MGLQELKLVEVAARDGLQNEKKILTPETRIDFIKRLAQVGFKWIEAGSFVHPKAVPAMAGSDEIADYFSQQPVDAELSFLVPNAKGLSLALEHGVRHIAVFLSATEAFSRANLRMSITESFEMISGVMAKALESDIKVRGYLSTVFGGLDNEAVDPTHVAKLANQLIEMGCYEISLGDTTGVATPEQTTALIRALVQEGISLEKIAMHYHDTHHRAIENIEQAYKLGIRIFDASTAGLGGCPFAKSATGNVDMFKVIQWADKKGLLYGEIDQKALIDLSHYIQALLQ